MLLHLSFFFCEYFPAVLFFILVLRFRTLPRLMALLENGPFFRMIEHCTLGLLGLSLCLLLPATLAVWLLYFGGGLYFERISRRFVNRKPSGNEVWYGRLYAWLISCFGWRGEHYREGICSDPSHPGRPLFDCHVLEESRSFRALEEGGVAK